VSLDSTSCSPSEGRQLAGKLVHTFRRGELVYDRGESNSSSSFPKEESRKIPLPWVLDGPIVPLHQRSTLRKPDGI
jgi:hypothetical protein